MGRVIFITVQAASPTSCFRLGLSLGPHPGLRTAAWFGTKKSDPTPEIGANQK